MSETRALGRYTMYGAIASGGMAKVHLGRLAGSGGFARTVAVKRLHEQFASDVEFVKILLDEGRLASRIRHPSVVPTLDLLAEDGEVFVVMEYVHGESLSGLAREAKKRGERMPPAIAAAILVNALGGLHAAHEATCETGEPLGIVHRDVSPQNILVGTDGLARVLDFGIAKARGRLQTTGAGQVKGKLAYMAPEQLLGRDVDRRTDVYAASVVLWEALVGKRLFVADSEGETVTRVLQGEVRPPSAVAPEVPAALDAIVMRGLARDPAARFATARDFAIAIEDAAPLASTRQIGEWVQRVAAEPLAKRAEMLAELDRALPAQGAEARSILDEALSRKKASAPRAASDGLRSMDATDADATSADQAVTAAHGVASPIARTDMRGTSSRRALVIGAPVGVAIALLTIFVALRSTSASSAATATSPPPSVAAPSIAAPDRTTQASQTTAPVAQASVAPPSVVASAAPSPSVTAPAPRVTARAKPKANCTVPYVRGADGIERLKPECL